MSQVHVCACMFIYAYIHFNTVIFALPLYIQRQVPMSEVKGDPTEVITNPGAEPDKSNYAIPRPATLAPIEHHQAGTTHDG